MKPTYQSQPLFPLRDCAKRHSIVLLLLGVLAVAASGCMLPIQGIVTAQEGLANVQPSTPIIAIAPDFGTMGTAIAVAGAGWQPMDIVTLKLASSTEPLALEESITVATVDENGSFTAAMTFPTAERWRVFPTVFVVAESAQTGVRALAAFEFLPAGLTVTPIAIEELSPTPTATGPTPTWTPLPTSQTPDAATPTPTPAPLVISPTASATPIRVDVNQVYVISAGLNVRSGPGVGYAVVRQIRYGTVLTVLGQSSGGGWLQVQLADGTIGWVSRYYTSNSSNPPVVQPSITPSVTPSNTPTDQVNIDHWRGEYYPNRYLAGSPALVRNEATLDFKWGDGSPATGIPSDSFSARWTRSPYFDGGRYRFRVRVDDGVRLYLDDNLIIDQWNDGSEREYTADRDLGSGNHRLRAEYYDNTGVARFVLWWERISSTDDDDEEFPDWKGEYYTNRDLDDDPRFRRNDEEIDFNWGDDSPDDRIPDDNFSVRWTRRVRFDPGHYRFELRADDGIRFYIDGNRVVNEWHENDYDNDYAIEFDLDGRHNLTIEYYERRGGARVYFDWDRIGAIVTTTPTATPAITTPTATPTLTTNTPTATPTATATVIQPSANVQPNVGGPGTMITVNGGGFPANTTVNVHLGALVGVRSSAAADPTSYATAVTDRTGSYSVAFALPTTWPDSSPIETGQLLVLVATGNFSAQASTLLDFSTVAPTATATATATPTGTQLPTATATATSSAPSATATPVPQPFVKLDPTAAKPGTLVRLSGGGFPGNTTVSLYLGIFDGAISPNEAAVTFASTITDGDGNYTMSFVMSEDTPTGALIPSGKIAVVVATDGFSLQASATLDFTGVAPTPTPEPTATVAAASDSSNGTIPPVNE